MLPDRSLLIGQKLVENDKIKKFKCEICGQTVLPDRSLLIEQKFSENAKMSKFKCDNLSNFQTLCSTNNK